MLRCAMNGRSLMVDARHGRSARLQKLDSVGLVSTGRLEHALLQQRHIHVVSCAQRVQIARAGGREQGLALVHDDNTGS